MQNLCRVSLDLERGNRHLLFLCEIPLYGLAKALVEVDLGLVAKLLGRASDVRQRVLDIAGSGRSVDWLPSEAELVGDGRIHFVERLTLPGADVEHAACSHRAGRVAGEQVGTDGVVYVIEVPAGEPVSEDSWRLSRHHLVRELRDDAGIGRVRSLPRAKDVEVAQADSLEVVGAVKSQIGRASCRERV